ncbi:TPA: hypothetical protein EYP66_07045 [Candidatus Poribacteria bacterium]|nr:hypothetical protein [Candidatus Poribacteria bacterium]
MKRVLLLSALFFILAVQVSWGQIPETISYQGVLTDTDGIAVSDGDYNLTFKLYDVDTGGTELWSEEQLVQVSKGIFNVILGSVNPLTLPFDKQYWLGIAVEGGSELEPRIKLTASAYSLNARSGGGGGGNTLDQAYDQGGAGAGRTINADAGAVNIAGPDGLTVEGNVGIGTTSPAVKLQVQKPDTPGASIDEVLRIGKSGASKGGDGAFINFDFGGYSFGQIASVVETVDQGSLRFYTRDTTPAVSERMRITTNGNVGIGTTSPAYKLDVAGTIRSSSEGFVFPDETVQTTAATGDGIDLSAEEIRANQLSLRNPTTGYSRGILNVDSSDNFNISTLGSGHLKLIAPGVDISAPAGAWVLGDLTVGDPQQNQNLYVHGNVGVGTENPQSELAVNGTVTAKEVVVTLDG